MMLDWLPSFDLAALGALLPIMGWIGLGGGTGIGLFVLAAVLPAPLGWLRKWIVIAAAFVTACTFTYAKGTHDGAVRVHAQWAAAERAAAERGAAVRKQAEREIPQAPRVRPGDRRKLSPRRVPAQPRDPYDRDRS